MFSYKVELWLKLLTNSNGQKGKFKIEVALILLNLALLEHKVLHKRDAAWFAPSHETEVDGINMFT